MQDKRIIKTKQNIRRTLIEMLREQPFERITVAELCRKAIISRITFYTHYDDKYALIDELCDDYVHEADVDYHRLQAKNNPERNGIKGYDNLLECILNLVYNHFDFFSQATTDKNPYLYTVFYNRVYINVAEYFRRHSGLTLNYPEKETAALICNGMFGVMNVGTGDMHSEEQVRTLARSMYHDLLTSALFKHNKALF